MKKILALFVCTLLFGCTNLFGPQAVEAPKRVRTLGVLPVLVDTETINHSNPDGLVALLEESSGDVAEWLIADLRKTGGYFDVRKVEGDPAQLFSQVVAHRAAVAGGDTSRFIYTYNPDGVTELISNNLVDAVLVVIINGVKRTEKRWDQNSTTLQYLTAEYRSLLYSAAVVAPGAESLWTRTVPSDDFFLRLDYPDFTEAYWIKTDKVRIKEITLPGLQRTLAEREKSLFIKTTTSKIYNQMVRDLVEQLKKGM